MQRLSIKTIDIQRSLKNSLLHLLKICSFIFLLSPSERDGTRRATEADGKIVPAQKTVKTALEITTEK